MSAMCTLIIHGIPLSEYTSPLLEHLLSFVKVLSSIKLLTHFRYCLPVIGEATSYFKMNVLLVHVALYLTDREQRQKPSENTLALTIDHRL